MSHTAHAIAACTLTAAFTVGACAQSQIVHKCTADGKVTYTEVPCAGGVILDVPATPTPDRSAKERQADLQRMNRESRALEKERRRQQAADDRNDERINRAHAQRRQRCGKLELDKKWADDDVRRAQPQAVDGARLKARRAAERYALECAH